jgi:hypothetical protein
LHNNQTYAKRIFRKRLADFAANSKRDYHGGKLKLKGHKMNSPYAFPAPQITMSGSNIMQLALLKSLEKMNLQQADLDKAQSQISAIGLMLDAYDNAISLIHQNGDLSAQGRASQILAISADYLKRLDLLTAGTLTTLASQIKADNNALALAVKGADATLISELRAQEIRKLFGEIIDLMRPSVYQKLIRDGNYEAVIAIERAPLTPLLPEDIIDEGQAERAALVLPERVNARDAAISMLDALTTSARFAKKHMTLARTNDPLNIAPAGDYPIDGSA